MKSKFNEVFGDIGGIFTVDEKMDAYLDVFRQAIKVVLDPLYASKSIKPWPMVNYDFINNVKFNAVAAKSGQDYFVGINGGTVAILHNLFARMLCHKQILTDFGNPDVESEEKKIVDPQSLRYDTLLNYRKEGGSVIPNDPIRKNLAWYLSTLAVQFICMHEYGHVLNGHLDLINSQGITSLPELPYNDEKPRIEPILSQTLELDADAFAVRTCLTYVLGCVNSPLNPEHTQLFYKDHRTTIRLFCFYTYTIHRLFGALIPNVKDLLNVSHPPSGTRQIRFIPSIILIANVLAPEISEQEIYKIVIKASAEVEDAFKKISDTPMDDMGIRFAMTEHAVDHSDLISYNWNNVRPLLEEYCYSHLLPLKVRSSGFTYKTMEYLNQFQG